MKRFWLVMLSLGLVLAFSASAFAADVKVSGSYYAAGMYLDRVSLRDKVNGVAADSLSTTSTAFYYQRLRVKTDFIVSPGLTLITRFDAMERIWGGARTGASQALDYTDSAGTTAENQNIAFDWAYIQYATPIGRFEAGYMNDGPWGTVFADSDFANPRVTYMSPAIAGGLYLFATAVKLGDSSYSYYQTTQNATDRDSDKYAVAAFYVAKDWRGRHLPLVFSKQPPYFQHLPCLRSFSAIYFPMTSASIWAPPTP